MSEHVTSGTDARVLRSCGRSEHARTHAAAAAHAAKLRVSSHSATPSPPTPAPRSPHQKSTPLDSLPELRDGTDTSRVSPPARRGENKLQKYTPLVLCCARGLSLRSLYPPTLHSHQNAQNDGLMGDFFLLKCLR